MKNPTYADIASKIKKDVDKFQKVLNDPLASKLHKHTAELNLKSRQALLDKLASIQEQQKQSFQMQQPVEQPMGQPTEQPQFWDGGDVKKTKQLGPVGYSPTLEELQREQVKQALIKNQMEFEKQPHVRFGRKDNPVSNGYTTAMQQLYPELNQPLIGYFDKPKYPNGGQVPEIPIEDYYTLNPFTRTEPEPIYGGSGNIIGYRPKEPMGIVPYLPGQVPTGGGTTPQPQTPGTTGNTDFVRTKFNPVEFRGEIPQETKIPPNWIGLAPAATNIAMGIFGKPDYLNPTDYMVSGHKDPLELDVRPEMQQIRESDITNRRRISNMSPSQIAAAQAGSGDWKAKATERLGRMKNEYDTNQISQADQINLGLAAENRKTKFIIDDYNMQTRAKKDQMLGVGAEQLGEWATNTRNEQMLLDQMYKEQMNAYNNMQYQADVYNSSGQFGADTANADYENMMKRARMAADAARQQITVPDVKPAPDDGSGNPTVDDTPKSTSLDWKETVKYANMDPGNYPANANELDKVWIDETRKRIRRNVKSKDPATIGTVDPRLGTINTNPWIPVSSQVPVLGAGAFYNTTASALTEASKLPRQVTGLIDKSGNAVTKLKDASHATMKFGNLKYTTKIENIGQMQKTAEAIKSAMPWFEKGLKSGSKFMTALKWAAKASPYLMAVDVAQLYYWYGQQEKQQYLKSEKNSQARIMKPMP